MDFVDGNTVHSDCLRDRDRDWASHVVCHFWRICFNIIEWSWQMCFQNIIREINFSSSLKKRVTGLVTFHYCVVLENQHAFTVSNFVQISHTRQCFLSALKSIFPLFWTSVKLYHIGEFLSHRVVEHWLNIFFLNIRWVVQSWSIWPRTDSSEEKMFLKHRVFVFKGCGSSSMDITLWFRPTTASSHNLKQISSFLQCF